MRGHGDPNQPDPTIDAHGGINISIPGSAASLSNAVHNGTAPCNDYLATASADLRAGATDRKPADQDALVKYSQCMRANGIPDYPDPGTGSEMKFPSDIDPHSPFFLRANDNCGRQIEIIAALEKRGAQRSGALLRFIDPAGDAISSASLEVCSRPT